jgi:aryl-alcohol dehydrogenase
MSKSTNQIKAAVVRGKGGPFGIETLSLEGPRRDEVLVKVVATGMCHTDMVARDTVYPYPIQSCLATKAQESLRA